MNVSEWWVRIKTTPISDVIKHKHRFVVMDTNTFKEKFSFQLSGINLFVTVGITVIVLILLTTVLIAFTPLREWIPGYANSEMVEETYNNAKRVDSIETLLSEQEWMVSTLQAILRGEKLGGTVEQAKKDSTTTLEQVAKAYRHSKEDSLLRLDVEREDNRYEVKASSTVIQSASTGPESTIAIAHLFFEPLKGKILTHFDAARRHLGVDIAAKENQVVNATYSGTVVSANFTADAGYVIAIQHPGNVISVYQNNNSLLKRQGDAVRAGEPIAYVGKATSGKKVPSLHFELWVNGSPVNPEEYISF